jgi:hypothetical protein
MQPRLLQLLRSGPGNCVLAGTVLIGVGGALFAFEVLSTMDLLTRFGLLLLAGTLDRPEPYTLTRCLATTPSSPRVPPVGARHVWATMRSAELGACFFSVEAGQPARPRLLLGGAS